jgi:predicted MFS family arabinose efflux permease
MAAALVVAERTGKALRGPARDVLLSEATQEVGHGFGFGLHSIMDQTGAVVGPLVMMIAVSRSNHQFGPAFLWLVVPALGTLIALTAARVLHPTQGSSAKMPGTQTLPRVFWFYVAAAGLLALGFVDFPLLAFHFESAGFFKQEMIPLLYAGAMGVNGLTAFVFGRMFDRFGLSVLALGTLVSLVSLPLGFLGGPQAAVASVGCWAVGLGAQDACLRSGISQVVSMNKRGNAFGAFNGVFGVLWFLGSVAMGLLYDRHALPVLVAFGIAAQAASAAMFLWIRRPLAETSRRG